MSRARLTAVHYAEGPAAVQSIVPETLVFKDGAAQPVELGRNRGKLLVITLEVSRVTEQDGLMVSVWGSADKSDWGTAPLLMFPPKSYCGVYSSLLNLAHKPELGFVCVHWNLRRWMKGESNPAFGFAVYAEESGARIAGRRPPVPRLEVMRNG